MKKYALFLTAGFFSLSSFCQDIEKVLNAEEALRMETVLSADSLKGRKTGSPGIEMAASFIMNEFKESKLDFFGKLNTYKQEFTVIRSKFLSAEGNWNGTTVDSKNMIVFSSIPEMEITGQSGYRKAIVRNDEDLNKAARSFIESQKNYIVLVDSAQTKNFGRLTRLKRDMVKRPNTVLFVLNTFMDPNKTVTNPDGTENYSFKIKQEITELPLANVVGVIKGKSKPEEWVVFSAHYDHLGVGKPNANQDSIYNGANDDVSGTTAVMMLAHYFNSLPEKPERSIAFVAFTAEETGGAGSRYFSLQTDPDKVVAMFNIEMIGTESMWGTNSAYITGYERSDMGKILQQNLQGSAFHFEPDPYPQQNLFYRSDNATLAALGVPAHTISTSKMDNEPNYHKQSDEISTLDMNNMAAIIRSIALSSRSIISGKDTPSRVKKID